MQIRFVFLCLAVVAAACLGCGPNGHTDQPGGEEPTVTAPSCADPSSECAPPDTTVALTNHGVSNANGQVDTFAWQTFIAMNWPAIEPSEANGYTRGIPDTTQPFGANVMGVWETFKEKREVFNHGTVSGTTFTPEDPGPWYAAVDYGPLRAADGEELGSPQPHPAGARVFHQTGKQVFNALDETIEVQSEEREKDDPKIHFGSVVAPRVWRLDTTDNSQTPVLYEVKVNYDFYSYVREFGLWSDATSQQIAMNTNIDTEAVGIHLPWRTSTAQAGLPPSNPPQAPQAATRQTNAVQGYSAASTAGAYRGFSSSASPPSEPPGIGSVHIKAAWIMLTPEEIASGTYHTAEAYSYRTDALGQPVAELSTFGLIGLHIIQRIHFTDPANTQTGVEGAGGTFVFATWEHKSIQDSIDNPGTKVYQYANYYDPVKNGLSGQGYFGKVYDVTRRPGAVLAQTQQVNDTVHATFPADSVWRNYDLIGTQFLGVDTTEVAFDAPPDSAQTTLGQNSYLANLVIETNHGLQNFRGLPPGIVLPPASAGQGAIVPPYSESQYFTFTGNSNSGPVFDRDAANLAAVGTAHNMGGCMGCHGVAQLQGFNFSFVLLGGNAGAKTDTEDRFDLPLGTPDAP